MPRIDLSTIYMEMAYKFAQLSYSERKKVGAVIVKDNKIISYGYNGTPSGFDNKCEDENGDTKPEVIHAELNAILKIATSNISVENADLYVTMSPCLECAKLIIQAKIKNVYFHELYRKNDGLSILEKANINVKQITNLKI